MLIRKKLKICVIGLGYVGLPLLVKLNKFFDILGYDNNSIRIQELKKGIDRNLQIKSSDLSSINFTNNKIELKNINFFIVTVPTPVTKSNKPDLRNLSSASLMISNFLKKGDIVVYESTVYPGCTENFCNNFLKVKNKLKLNKDYFLGYSPERISPGEKKYTIEKITKIISSSDPKSLKIIKYVYSKIINNIYIASSIKVAEAAKVIENSQRDLNIAFVNQLSKIFHLLKLDTQEVLNAASTKWNFVKYSPGLVGGHCIGVDPYYLTYISKKNGYNPKFILSGRTLNNSISSYVYKRCLSLIRKKKILKKNLRILILGITFKENCPDIRNSRVFDIIDLLNKKDYYIDIYDPWVDKNLYFQSKKINLIKKLKFNNLYDGIILAVAHQKFKNYEKKLKKLIKKNNFIFDIKSFYSKKYVDERL